MRGRHASRPVAYLTARRALFDVCLTLGKCGAAFTRAALVNATGLSKSAVADAVADLIRGGALIQEKEERVAAVGTLRVAAWDDNRRTGQDRMWAAMKPLGSFTAAELSMSTGGAVPIDAAKSYVRRLASAGYLMVIEKSHPGRLTRYRIRPGRDTGPRPPAVRRDKSVFDRNLGRVVGPEDEL